MLFSEDVKDFVSHNDIESLVGKIPSATFNADKVTAELKRQFNIASGRRGPQSQRVRGLPQVKFSAAGKALLGHTLEVSLGLPAMCVTCC